MKHIGLFEGIGGFSLAARWMGWETVAWCEWNEFGQQVLKHHFPEADGYGDITKTNFTKYANTVDIVTGGFPCQPYSLAGKKKGKADDRHLWPEMLRAIREIQPRWVIGENVPGIINWSRGMVVKEIKTDLENEGFKLLPPVIIPACAVNAPHRRDRIWFIAYAEGINGGKEYDNRQSIERRTPAQSGRLYRPQTWAESNDRDFLETSIFSKHDGLPGELDGITFSKWLQQSIKAYGNAIVPQVAYELFRVIELMEVEIMNCQPGDEVKCGVGKKIA